VLDGDLHNVTQALVDAEMERRLAEAQRTS
jgi:peptide chain release factor 1